MTRRGAAPPGPRRRAQGIVEFGLVAPVFLFMIAAFVLMILVVVNQQIAESAARAGARDGLVVLSNFTRSMAETPITSAIHEGAPRSTWVGSYMRHPISGGTYSNGIRNSFYTRLDWVDGNPSPTRMRQGWDWGIVALHRTQLAAALTAAVQGAQARSGVLAVGSGPQTRFRACFLDAGETSCPGSQSMMAQAHGLTGGVSVSGAPALTRSPAPRFLQVEISLDQFGGTYTWVAYATERVDRFAAACAVPTTINEQRRDGCGAVYWPW